ncbi:hypothetical protein SAMN05720473_101690 [Fibrobacter sp. UWB15]|uniref:hypothetical protein n=1 Tax=unclassified Fibrobacter TaxID=2634177 RepID=UPI00091906FE|nr:MULTISPECIES: hypothetical protein [unclassified Fibrobacter]PWJ67813.1 hypothetical protein BGW99_101690 [Fibrobacter sp. UWB6]SHF78885.1 hypothetical protein SAMN05720760_101655 [Fibrobacter sp. UWB8]SMG15368.1 hypothetical protein SAMN05720473_101690 [Fibrobacter sp. UWB15]
MKKISFLLFPALTAAAFFVACSDDDSSSRKVITEVNSIYELGICGEDNQGDTVYAKKEDAQYYCDDANWVPVATKESTGSSSSSSQKASSSSMTKAELDKFTELCKASGGKVKDGACSCKNELCDVGAVCNTITGICGNQSKPTDIDSTASSSSTVTTFADLCKASGGTAKDGACVCDEVSCDEGVLCNTKSKECANKDAVEIECDDSYKSTCSDSPASIGIVKECVKGIVVNRSCGTVSCNEEGTDCGECLNDVQTCTEDKNFKATVTHCEKGKKVTESCDGKSCDPRDNGCGECTNYEHTCTNDDEGKGTVYECVAGEAKKAVSICGNKSCRTDKAICGECLNGELRCDNDINNNAVMYRCVDGQWERLHNKFDPLDKEYYQCPVACREGTDPQKMEIECDIDQCSDCDPCWGEPMVGAPSNPNPCYDEERCKQILKDEDPAYPPFRDFETKKKWKALIPEEKMAVKTVTGYNWKDYTHTDVNDRVGPFEFDLTNETRRVSCNALGTYFGKCHNTLQTCINKAYHTGGFMVVCSNGDLVDAVDGEEPNGDGIACNCEDLGNVNAYGCCYTRSACFKQTNWSRDRCAKPKSTAADE